MRATRPGAKEDLAPMAVAVALPILLAFALTPGVLGGMNACMLDTGECVCEGEDNARCLQLTVRTVSHQA